MPPADAAADATVAPWLSLHFSHVTVSRVGLGAQIRRLLTVEQVNNCKMKIFIARRQQKEKQTNKDAHKKQVE